MRRFLQGWLSLLLALSVTCGNSRNEDDASPTARSSNLRERIVERLLDTLDDATVTLGPLPASDRPITARVLLGHSLGSPLEAAWVTLDGHGRAPRTEALEGGRLRLLESACAVIEVTPQQDLTLTVHMAPERLVGAAGQRVAGQPVVVELDQNPSSSSVGCRTSFLVGHGLMPRQVENPVDGDDDLLVSELSFTTMSQTRAVAVVLATGLEISFGLRTHVDQQPGATAQLGAVRLAHQGVEGLSHARFRSVHPPDPLLLDDSNELRVKPTLECVVRDAMLAPPGTRICWTLDIPEAGALRFATGVAWNHSATPGRDVVFRVRCGDDSVFEATQTTEQRGWSDQQIRLDDCSGRRELCFETSAADGPGTLWSLWGTPEVTALRPPAEEPPPQTIILVSVDTLRADRLGLYGYEYPTSPNLDRLGRGAAIYENHVAQTGWTLPSHVSMLTGLAPEAHGVTGQMDRILDLLEVGFDPTVPTLAAALRRAGYSTHAIVSAPYLDPTFGFDRGFDSYDASTISSHLRSHQDMTAPQLARLSRRLIENSGTRPLFLFLHFWDVHYDYIPPREDLAAVHRQLAEQPLDYTQVRHPFTRHVDPALLRLVMIADPTRPPPEFYGRVRSMLPSYPRVNAFMQLMSDLYDGEVRTVDRHLGLILEDLRRADRGDWALLLTGDHGESFMEHGTLGHGVDNIFSEGLIVPLVLHAPGRVTAARRRSPSMTVDIAATLLDLAGLDALPNAHGRSLLRPAESSRLVVGHDGSFSRLQATLDHHRLLVWGLFGPDQLFDLESDSAELIDISERESERLATLRRSTARYLLAHGRGVHIAVVGDDDPSGVVITLEGDVPLRPAFAYGPPDTGTLSWEREHRLLRLRAAPAAGQIVALTALLPDEAEIRWSAATYDGQPVSTALVIAGASGRPSASGTLDDGFALGPNALPDDLGDRAGAIHLWRTPAFSVRAPLTMQDETMEQLRALGYLRGQGPAVDAGAEEHSASP